MKILLPLLTLSAALFAGTTSNQTDELTPILPPDALPFEIAIEVSDFQLPIGLQSFVYATYDNKWLLLAGRVNGMHGFNPTNNFPPRAQNGNIYVVDPVRKTVVSRSLTDPSSGLSQAQIETLSVTAPQYTQSGSTLYMVGGYGFDSATGSFSTKSTLTAIDVPGLISWVEGSKGKAVNSMRQTSHPLLQVTGGFLTRTAPHQPFLLIFGQSFTGAYTGSGAGYTQVYTQQVRPFQLIDNGTDLYIKPGKEFPRNPNYRRRDLSVLPIVQQSGNSYSLGVVALSGVFTLDAGVWTVPVLINGDGTSLMPSPSDPNTFKQGMNNYDCARTGLFSKERNEMYMLLFGGISYLTVSGGSFVPDSEDPFINSVTTVQIDAQGSFHQYLMENEYPLILSPFGDIGHPLLFGAEARFITANTLPTFPNGVFSFDALGSSRILLGHIVGGIQSSQANNSAPLIDSAASPYIFSVYLQRR